VIGLRSARRRDRQLVSPSPFSFSVAGGSTAPGEARNIVADRFAGTVDDASLDALRLLVSEVTTNCVQHGHADAATTIDVDVSLPPDAVRVEVSTAGPPFVNGSAAPRRPDPEDPRGRGLYIVDAISERWGVEPNAPNTVWFELATVPAG